MALLEILTALKEADEPSAPQLAWAWRGLSDHIDRRYRLGEREHADVRQRTLLKVMGAVAGMDADAPGRAEAWLRRVHRSARADHHRNLGDKLMDRALRATPKDGDGTWIERVGPKVDPVESPPVDEEAALDAALASVLERASAWIDDNVENKAKRAGDLRRAQVSLLANVRGHGYDAIVDELGLDPPPSKSAVYKWIERGREQVLLPALEGWEHPATHALVELLVGSRRADAGKPRPRRRADVSRSEGASSKKGRKKK